MRGELRRILINEIPEFEGRVFEQSAATPQTVKPFCLVNRGVGEPGEPYADLSTVIEVWPFTDRTSFTQIDTLVDKILAVLDRRRFDETLGGVTRRYASYYIGDTRTDYTDDEWQGYTRAVAFRVYELGWLSGLTYEPDPIAGMREWLRLDFSEMQQVDITGGPTGGTFALDYGGIPSGPIPWNASITQVMTALGSIPALTGNVEVLGYGGFAGCTNFPQPVGIRRFWVRFTGARSTTDVPQLIGISAGLTGGTTPAVTGTTIKEGIGLQTDPLTWNPADANPAIYFRLDRVVQIEMENWGSWITANVRGHILNCAHGVGEWYTRRLAERLSLLHHTPMSDGSEVEVLAVATDPIANPFTMGQVQCAVRWGILDTAPDRTNTGGTLVNAPGLLVAHTAP